MQFWIVTVLRNVWSLAQFSKVWASREDRGTGVISFGTSYTFRKRECWTGGTQDHRYVARSELSVIRQPLQWHMNTSTNIEHTCYRLLSFLIPMLHDCVGGGLRDEKSSPRGEGGIVRAAACTCAEGESAVMF